MGAQSPQHAAAWGPACASTPQVASTPSAAGSRARTPEGGKRRMAPVRGAAGMNPRAATPTNDRRPPNSGGGSARQQREDGRSNPGSARVLPEPLPSHTVQVPLGGPENLPQQWVGAPENPRVHRQSSDAASRSSQAPVYIRLYQEKDERRRRLEEARSRRLLEEEEDLRAAAQKALGRAPSPGRAQSPDTSFLREHGAQPSTRSGVVTPPRVRPPLPEQASAAAGGKLSRASSTGALPKGRGGGGAHHKVRTACGGAQGSSAHAANNGMPSGHFRHSCHSLQGASSRDGSPSTSARGLLAPGIDVSSIASESGAALGLQSVPSVSVLSAGEDCGDGLGVVHSHGGPGNGDDAQGMQQLVASQQQRIEFLENMHQQALRQLRRSREELAQAQQQRLHEADKLLGLEQLISEMQAHRFEGDRQMQRRWEEWLQRSRSILES